MGEIYSLVIPTNTTCVKQKLFRLTWVYFDDAYVEYIRPHVYYTFYYTNKSVYEIWYVENMAPRKPKF